MYVSETINGLIREFLFEIYTKRGYFFCYKIEIVERSNRVHLVQSKESYH